MKKYILLLNAVFLLFLFSCNKNQAPDVPSLTSPTNGATEVEFETLSLTWACTDADSDILTYDLYFGTLQDPVLLQTGLTTTSYEVTELEQNTTYYWKVVAKDAETQSESTVASFTTKEQTVNNTTCIDYDGNEYEIVQIGNQIWMAEDLRSLHYSDGTAIPNPLAYNNQEDLVQYYGRLYTWEAMMNGASSTNDNPSGVQGIAPEGWHVPSRAEWLELIAFLGGNSVAGGKMKATGTDYWASPNTGATNSSGFNGKGCGVWDFGANDFTNLWYYSEYWTSTMEDDINAYFVSLGYDTQEAYTPDQGMSSRYMYLSVRCIKD